MPRADGRKDGRRVEVSVSRQLRMLHHNGGGGVGRQTFTSADILLFVIPSLPSSPFLSFPYVIFKPLQTEVDIADSAIERDIEGGRRDCSWLDCDPEPRVSNSFSLGVCI